MEREFTDAKDIIGLFDPDYGRCITDEKGFYRSRFGAYVITKK